MEAEKRPFVDHRLKRGVWRCKLFGEKGVMNVDTSSLDYGSYAARPYDKTL